MTLPQISLVEISRPGNNHRTDVSSLLYRMHFRRKDLTVENTLPYTNRVAMIQSLSTQRLLFYLEGTICWKRGRKELKERSSKHQLKMIKLGKLSVTRISRNKRNFQRSDSNL